MSSVFKPSVISAQLEKWLSQTQFYWKGVVHPLEGNVKANSTKRKLVSFLSDQTKGPNNFPGVNLPWNYFQLVCISDNFPSVNWSLKQKNYKHHTQNSLWLPSLDQKNTHTKNPKHNIVAATCLKENFNLLRGTSCGSGIHLSSPLIPLYSLGGSDNVDASEWLKPYLKALLQATEPMVELTDCIQSHTASCGEVHPRLTAWSWTELTHHLLS